MKSHSKKCFKCEKIKHLSEFYKHKKMSDGLLNKCIVCSKIDSKKIYNKNSKSINWRLKERERTKERNKRLYSGNYKKRDPRKKRANNAVSNAIRDAGLIRPTDCTFSFDDYCFGRIEAHHYDYERPLIVLWLCTKHHRYIHKKLTEK